MKARKKRPGHAGKVWSRKFGRWIDRDTRSSERKAADEAILQSVRAEEGRFREELRAANAMKSEHLEAMSRAAEFLADRVLGQLREARQQAGLTQTEVAGRMGVPPSAVVRLEGGHHSPTLTTLTRYAAAIGVRLEVRRIA